MQTVPRHVLGNQFNTTLLPERLNKDITPNTTFTFQGPFSAYPAQSLHLEVKAPATNT